MYLVDTSVWIDYFREKNNEAVNYFIDVMNHKLPFGITSLIYQEILQGAASQHDFKQLDEYLSTQLFFNPKDERLTYQIAAQSYFDCRRKGITLRSSIDCLIAQIAIEHDLVLLHNDQDYRHIAKINRKLQLAPN